MQLAIIEPIHPKVHGIFPSLDKRRGDWFIVYSTDIDTFYYKWEILANLSEWIQSKKYPAVSHPIIGNYNKIINRFKSLEIIKPLYYETENGLIVHLAIVKTFWLRIFQKRWRNKYRKRIQKRKNPKVLFQRSITGKW